MKKTRPLLAPSPRTRAGAPRFRRLGVNTFFSTNGCGYRSRLALRLAGTTLRTKKAPVETGARLMETRTAKGLLVGARLERGAENIAQRRARVGGAVLSDGLLLLGDFQ